MRNNNCFLTMISYPNISATFNLNNKIKFGEIEIKYSNTKNLNLGKT